MANRFDLDICTFISAARRFARQYLHYCLLQYFIEQFQLTCNKAWSTDHNGSDYTGHISVIPKFNLINAGFLFSLLNKRQHIPIG